LPRVSLVDVINESLEATIPAAHRMGLKAVEARRGFASASVPLEGNANHFGVVYAGVEFTVAEILGGIIAIASFDAATYYPLVKRLEIDFTAPGQSDLIAEASLDEGELSRIESEAAEHGKAEYLMDAVVRDASGQTVAVTHGVYQLRSHGA
jgi:acyl-coenzyme A thioesterase PaaI-like protein